MLKNNQIYDVNSSATCVDYVTHSVCVYVYVFVFSSESINEMQKNRAVFINA